ncbi:hypothetical protein MNBD_GAMMA12-242 [hydrothermal vent metagenome]|uniref:Peptidase M23 domain-containing protein n=1 Tax=hydrothermal vent metagenome TaxID=652676 RepID=A0A3B0ZCC4_9ZZZZ
MNKMSINNSLSAITIALCSVYSVSTFSANKSFPFYATQLKAGERFYAPKHAQGSQGKGFDISMLKKRSNGRWYFNKPGTSGSRNSHSVIYAKKFYAISDGIVFRCWRNAPQNPRPGSYHPQNGLRIPGGGNMVWVKQSDGTNVLYAHAIPGTIPSSVCPLNARLYSAKGRTYEANVPKVQQVKIRKGQFLGRVGNSGNSGGTHLHVHIQKRSNNAPVPIRWSGGLATRGSRQGARFTVNLNRKWYNLTGKTIPVNRSIIWPPFKTVGSLTRNNIRIRDFRRFFDHAASSGFYPVKLKGYVRNGELHYDSKWLPANQPWLSWYGISKTARNSRVSYASSKGFRKIYEWFTTVNGTRLYSLIFVK